MRVDEDNSDELQGEVEVKPTVVELWNYDKMKKVESYETDFKAQREYKWTVFSENMEIVIQRCNEWEDEMKKKEISTIGN